MSAPNGSSASGTPSRPQGVQVRAIGPDAIVAEHLGIHFEVHKTEDGGLFVVDHIARIEFDPSDAIVECRQSHYLDATATTVWLAGGGEINMAVSDTGRLLSFSGTRFEASINQARVLTVRSYRGGDEPGATEA